MSTRQAQNWHAVMSIYLAHAAYNNYHAQTLLFEKKEKRKMMRTSVWTIIIMSKVNRPDSEVPHKHYISKSFADLQNGTIHVICSWY